MYRKSSAMLKAIRLRPGGSLVSPLVLLADEHGGEVVIILDDHCYVCLMKRDTNHWEPISWLFPELVVAIKELPIPK